MASPSESEREWSDSQLTAAVAASRSWRGVMRELGLYETSAGSIRIVRRHVTRLELDTSHFTGQRTWSDARLIQAAPHARSWSGLLAAIGVKSSSRAYRTRVKALEIKRVQVKTTTYYSRGGWQVAVGRRPYSAGNRKGLVPYDPELIDWFFIVDGDLAMYLIPSQVIAGRVQILLRTYVTYIVGDASGFMAPKAA